jgi:Multisubunit Na+/H+ antiporter, MnhC subunit
MTDAVVSLLTTRHAYVLFVLLAGIGLYMLMATPNLVKKLIGLNMFQTGIFLFFVTSAYRVGGSAPIVHSHEGPFVSPLPQVIVLTAIVVSVSLTAVGLALTIRLYTEYGTLRVDALREVMGDE